MTSTRRSVRARSRAAALLAAGVCAALVTSACTASTDAVDQTAGTEFKFTDATVKGQLIPAGDRRKPGAVSGQLLDGDGTYTLASDAGKVVVVNLWGSWCGPCKLETPQFEQVYQQTKAQGVDFVGFAVKEASENGPKAFVQDYGITYPIVYDQPVQVALQLGKLPVQAGMPQTVLIDKQGRVAAAYVGLVQPSELKPALASLVAES